MIESLLRDKFRRDPELRERLVQTGTRQLINVLPSDIRYGGGNSGAAHEDKLFWGVIEGANSGNGQNHLGNLLE